ncbi:MAG: aminoglycoside phosphotransferase family protein [Cyanobacteria bacterium P01_F01_bin.86]
MESEAKSSSPGTPEAELEIDTDLVYSLLEEQHPDLSHLPIYPVDAGWDNAMFRLGDRWCVRLPRRQIAAALIANEQTWLPQLAPHLLLPVPVPYRIGSPAANYPWRWSVLPWLTGVAADQAAPHADQAPRLAAFLRSLHTPAPANAPINPFRSVPLHQRAARVEECLQRLRQTTNLITPQIQHIWVLALETPMEVQPTWLHGDLHARNVLVQDGAITGIIDWGDITSGDMATDLAAIWMLFAEKTARQEAIAAYADISEATLQRAQGWAIFFGAMLLDTGLVNNPRQAAMAAQTLRRVSEDG